MGYQRTHHSEERQHSGGYANRAGAATDETHRDGQRTDNAKAQGHRESRATGHIPGLV